MSANEAPATTMFRERNIFLMVNAPFCTKACRSIGDANRAEGPHTSHSGVCVSSRRDWGLTSTDTKTTVSPWDSGSSSRTGTRLTPSAIASAFSEGIFPPGSHVSENTLPPWNGERLGASTWS